MAHRSRPLPSQLEVGYNGYNPGHYRSVSYQGPGREDTLGLEHMTISSQQRGQGNGYQDQVQKDTSGVVELE